MFATAFALAVDLYVTTSVCLDDREKKKKKKNRLYEEMFDLLVTSRIHFDRFQIMRCSRREEKKKESEVV